MAGYGGPPEAPDDDTLPSRFGFDEDEPPACGYESDESDSSRLHQETRAYSTVGGRRCVSRKDHHVPGLDSCETDVAKLPRRRVLRRPSQRRATPTRGQEDLSVSARDVVDDHVNVDVSIRPNARSCGMLRQVIWSTKRPVPGRRCDGRRRPSVSELVLGLDEQLRSVRAWRRRSNWRRVYRLFLSDCYVEVVAQPSRSGLA